LRPLNEAMTDFAPLGSLAALVGELRDVSIVYSRLRVGKIAPHRGELTRIATKRRQVRCWERSRAGLAATCGGRARSQQAEQLLPRLSCRPGALLQARDDLGNQ
jgi:hypothetical protein